MLQILVDEKRFSIQLSNPIPAYLVLEISASGVGW
jgi:hypothetical protein